MSIKHLFRPRMRMIHQAEHSECGLACVAMISSHHGQHLDLRDLRLNGFASARGTSLSGLMQLASRLGMTSRALKLNLDEIAQLQLPAILHWDRNHYVTLTRVLRGAVEIYNPALGIRRYHFDDLATHFGGIALEVTPGAAFFPRSSAREPGLLHYFRTVRGLAGILVQILVLSILIQLISLASPFYVQLVVDEVLIRNDVDLLSLLTLGFLVLTLVSTVTVWLRNFSELHLTQQLSFQLGASLFQHLVRLPLQYFQRRHIGDIQSRFGSLKEIQSFLTRSAISAVLDGIMATTTLVMIVLYSPLLAGLTVGSLALYLLLRLAMYAPLRKANLEQVTTLARQDTHFIETLRAIATIKISGGEVVRENSYQNRLVETINSGYHVGKLTISFETASSLVTGVSGILILYLGASEVMAGFMTIGMLYAFIAYQRHFHDAMLRLINLVLDYLLMRVHLERLSDISVTATEPGLLEDFGFSVPIDGDLRVESLGYSYSALDSPIIENFSIDIRAGQMIALFGPSGSGKSTLLNLLSGLVPPDTGRLFIDGVPLSALGIGSYRRCISVVLQDDIMLSGSILATICSDDVALDHERLERVARLAMIHEDILRLPLAYETRIGDMGTALSQGQQQRLLIARALYRQPRFLFMDEGTSHIDARTETQIMINIRKLGITCLFISHRPGLLKLANQVIRFNSSNRIELLARLPKNTHQE